MDVEGYEIKALPNMMKGKKILKNVRQIGIEIHTNRLKMMPETSIHKHMIYTLREMYQTFGFRLIHYRVNGFLGNGVPHAINYPLRYFKVFEAAFYKP